MRELLVPDAILKGTAVAVAICLPLALISDVVVDRDDPNPVSTALLVAILCGFAFAGWVAGRLAPLAPYTNGGLAAAAGFAVIQGVAVLVRIAGDEPIGWGRVVGSALLAFGAGMTGGLVAERRARRAP